MRNAEKFKEVFGLFSTELWTKTEKEFLEWANKEYVSPNKKLITCCRCFHKYYTKDIPKYAPNDKLYYWTAVCPRCGQGNFISERYMTKGD